MARSMAVVAVVAMLCMGSASASSPVQKTLQLLSDLEAKIVAQGKEAKATYVEFAEWCEDRSKNIKFEVTTSKSEISELKASIDKATSIVTAQTSKVEELASSIASNEADLKAAITIREQEKADFGANEKELLEVIDALNRAIAILQREARKGGSALLQLRGSDGVLSAVKTLVEASMLGSQDAQRLTALIQSQGSDGMQPPVNPEISGGHIEVEQPGDMGGEPLVNPGVNPHVEVEQPGDLGGEPLVNPGLGAPAAAVYENQSGGIIEVLEGLLDKAEEQLAAAREKETSAQHSFEMLCQSLKDEIKYSSQEMAEAKKTIASQTESMKIYQGDLSMETQTLSKSTQTMSTLDQDCMTGSDDYHAAEKSRAEELKALAAAKKVIKESTGGAEDITYSSASFLEVEQVSSLRTGADLANFEAVRLVRNLARQQKSEALMQLAHRMSAVMRLGDSGGDPFSKVKGLIEDMIAKLEKDAEGDASHKAYCDKEMGETAEKKAEKEAEMDKLTTKIDSATAQSAKLEEQIAAIQKELAELAAATAEMAKIRSEEKALYEKNRPEMLAGLEGVKMALKILREYYAKGDKAHAAAEGAGSGIIGLLEVVESDFSKTLAEMEASEAQAASDFDMESKMNEMEKTSKEQDVAYKTKESKQLDKAVSEAKSDLDGVVTEHQALLEYQAKLNEMCVAKPETYAQRKGRREAEIAGLKEALEILAGEAVLLQRGSNLRRKGGLRGATLSAA